MKKHYAFLPKNWLCFGLLMGFALPFSLNLSAQTKPLIQWDKTFGGSSNEELQFLQQTADGGYILGGNSGSGISGDKSQASKGFTDYWIIKLDASGNKIWDKTIGGNGSDYLTSINQTPDGGYILGGESSSGISGDKTQPTVGTLGLFEDYWIVKLDVNGNKLWDKVFGGSEEDEVGMIIPTIDGGFIIGGQSNSGISGDKSEANKGIGYDIWIVKVDGTGNKLWDKTFGSNGTDYFEMLQQTMDGGYIIGCTAYAGISGDKSEVSRGGEDYWIIKLDSGGNKIWDKTFGGSVGEKLKSIHQTLDSGYIISGGSGSGISGDKTQAAYGCGDFWTVKLNSAGNKVWDKSFGGSECEGGSIRQISNGTYILGGPSDSGIGNDKTEASKGKTDFWVLKLDGNGNKIWDKTLGGTEEDYLNVFYQTSDGGYILGGRSDSPISGDKSQISKGGMDFWIVKLAPDVLGIKDTETNFNFSIFPNPNQGKFNLQLSNLSTSKTEVTISDLLGRTVLKQEFQSSNHQLSEEINLPNAKGIYLLQLKAGEQIITRKIVVE